MSTSPVQQLHCIKTLLLVRREKWPDLCVELLENNPCFGPRFLMNRVQLRSHGRYERLDLGLLRIGQLQHMRQHCSHVRSARMAEGRRIIWCLRTGKLCNGHESRNTKCDRNKF